MKDQVFDKLQLLDVRDLGLCGVQLNLAIPPAKMGKKTAMRTFILRHLTSEELEVDDNVDEIFQTLNGSIDGMLADKDDDKKKVKTGGKQTQRENSGSSKMRSGEGSKDDEKDNDEDNEVVSRNGVTRVELGRFKEFKITNGTFGGDENKVDYRSLCYQIQEARSLKHTDKEIVSGIIKGMKSGSALQTYFQGKFNWTLEDLLKHLRSFCDVKESTVLLDQMVSTSQETTESEINFVLRMMGLRV